MGNQTPEISGKNGMLKRNSCLVPSFTVPFSGSLFHLVLSFLYLRELPLLYT